MGWVLLTVAAIICRAAYGLCIKLMSQRVSAAATSLSVLMLAVAGLLVVPLSPLLGGISTAGLANHGPALAAIVVSASLGNVFFFRGLQNLEAGISQIVFSSILGWSLILSIVFLDSRFTLAQLLGCLVLAVAIFMAQYDGRLKINSAVLYVLASAAMFAIFQVVSADVSRDITNATYLLTIFMAPAIVIGIVYAKALRADMASLRRTTAATLISTLPAVVSSLGYNVFAYMAYRAAPDAGVVVLLLTSQVVLAVLLSAMFLHERSRLWQKLAAGALAAAAGVLIHT